MGGDISVSSKENIGSTFWFEIPIEIPDSDRICEHTLPEFTKTYNKVINNPTTPLKVEEKKGGYMTTEAPSLEILVAEDNMINQAVIQGLLEKIGHKVTLAENGQDAVQWHSAKKFDVILMDINMPILDGIGACEEIRKVDTEIPIIAITANTLDEGRERCIAAGMNGFASKPVDKQKLMDLLFPYQIHKASKAASALENQATQNQKNISSPPLSEIKYIETSSLKQLIADLGVERIQKFLIMYQSDAPQLIQNLQSQIDLEHSAHTLAGMSENLSFIAIGKTSRGILGKIREGHKDEHFESLIHELPSLYEGTIHAAEDFLLRQE